MNRLLIIIYVIFCFELGIFLLVLPWASWLWWTRNFFVMQYPWLGQVVTNDFVRGTVSGVGVADILLAIHEFWRFRRELGVVRTHSQP